MSRENTYSAIILKKQSYGEGDELITVYTRELGKMRVLAKSTKFAKSKLQYSLQSLFVTRLTVTSSRLPKVIGVEVARSFPRVLEYLPAAKMAFYGLELVLKFTADEEKNEQLFNLFAEYLEFLDDWADNDPQLYIGLVKFKINFLNCLGLSIHAEPGSLPPQRAGFSNERGGFLFGEESSLGRPVSVEAYRQFDRLRQTPFSVLTSNENAAELQDLLTGFLEYQLERSVNSEKFLKE